MTNMNDMIFYHPGYKLVQIRVDPTTAPTKVDTQVNIDNLTTAITHLVDKMDAHPNSPFDWSTPATHFVDSLPGYSAITLAMVLAVVLLLGGSIIVAWSLYKKNVHAAEMLKSMVVPLEAFTAVVQQSATSNELLGRRIEELGENLGANLKHMSDSIVQMAHALNSHPTASAKTEHHPAAQRLVRPQS